MRILYVGPFPNIHMSRWAGYFARQGHEVRILSTDGFASEEALDGVSVEAFPLRRMGSHGMDHLGAVGALPAQVRRLRRALDAFRPDILHVHYLNEAALYAALTGFRPLVFTAWGSDVDVAPKRSRLRKSAIRLALRRAALVTCDAEHMRSQLVELLGARPDRVQVVFFGTDTEVFQGARRDARLRGELGGAGRPVVVSVRRLEAIYDIPTLLRAVPVVASKVPDVLFWIGGTGTLEGELRAMAERMGVSGNVRFIGSITPERMPAVLASADAYVSTAVTDGGLAASTAEAMASETPVVVTDVRDNRRWVQEGVSGKLFPEGDAEALGGALLELLGDPASRKRLGAAARDVIATRNSFQREMAAMGKLYEQVVGRRE